MRIYKKTNKKMIKKFEDYFINESAEENWREVLSRYVEEELSPEGVSIFSSMVDGINQQFQNIPSRDEIIEEILDTVKWILEENTFSDDYDGEDDYNSAGSETGTVFSDYTQNEALSLGTRSIGHPKNSGSIEIIGTMPNKRFLTEDGKIISGTKNNIYSFVKEPSKKEYSDAIKLLKMYLKDNPAKEKELNKTISKLQKKKDSVSESNSEFPNDDELYDLVERELSLQHDPEMWKTGPIKATEELLRDPSDFKRIEKSRLLKIVHKCFGAFNKENQLKLN